jgi:predicted ATPase
MQELNTRLQQEKGIRLAVRIGIHTGLVVVGAIGQGASQEHLALGETPNVASRIEGIAEPDTVTISEATHRLIQGYFSWQDLGGHDLKGVAEPMRVYRVLGESAAQSRLDIVSAHGLTPLVGREQEVGLLFERWRQVKDGQGQVVLLSGEAGIGKSRLLQVMKEHVAGETHVLLECRSSPYYQHTALYPIIDLLQRALRWQQGDTPEQRLAKLEQELSHYRLPLEESVSLFAPLLSLVLPEGRYPPLALSPQRQRQKTLETMMSMLLQQTERQPMLFLLEDLHWTDPSTLELMDLLIEQAPTTPICTILTCRPTFQPTWGSRSYLTQITLNHLSRSQIEQMAKQVAGGKRLPAEVLQQVVEKTDGVPLFVEELTKAVLESGVLKETDNEYALTGLLSALAIPATLQDSLMARLDRLVTAKAVAQYAAVIGRQFSYELLQAVSQLDAFMLQQELSRLVEAELLYQRGLPPQATYVFKHALIQDTAYESLLKSTRQQYHHRIAQVLEEQFPETVETQPELLAHHYTQANLVERAIGYWQQAGQRAIQRSAYVEAIAHLRQGLDLLTALPEAPAHLQQELDLQVALGPALLATKGYAAPDVERVYTRARELCQQVGNSSQFYPVMRGLMSYYLMRGESQTAHGLGEQLLRQARVQDDPVPLIFAHGQLGHVLFFRGEPTSAHSHHTQALAIYTPQEHRVEAVRYGIDLGVASHNLQALELWQLGYPEQAIEASQKGRQLAQEVSHLYSLATALIWAIVLHQFRREAQAVCDLAAALKTLTMEHTFAQWSGHGPALHGWALAMQGQGETGIAEMRRGVAADLATGAKAFQAYFLILLAEAYGTNGYAKEGLSLFSEALDVMDTTESRFYESELYRLRGVLLLKQTIPDTSQAETYFHKALDIARYQQAKSWELRAATSLARLWQSQGKQQEAYELLEPVYGWFTEGFDTADLKDAKALLDELG